MKQAFKKVIVRILQAEAAWLLRKHSPKIVAVTGSVGKTSTKDAIYAVLASTYHVRKSDKSYNSEFGVPLTVLGLRNAWNNPFLWIKNVFLGLGKVFSKKKYPDWLVLEVGADKPGDIHELTKWLKPDIAVVTAFGTVPVHVEFFASPQAVIEEKGFLVKALKPGGLLVVNNDDEQAPYFKSLTPGKVMTFGFQEGADITASHSQFVYEAKGDRKVPTGITFKANHKMTSVPITVRKSIGIQHIYPALAAISVGVSQDLNLVKIGEALQEHVPPRGRMRVIEGEKETTIIDDTYNSSPIALAEAQETVRGLKLPGRKIAVLGDMLELGKYSDEEHRKAGKLAAEIFGLLVTVGIRSRAMADAALDAGMDDLNVLQFDESREAGKYLEQVLKKDDLILVKGSQGMRMERIVEEIMAHPEDKEKLLVRQEGQWAKR